MSSLLIEIGGEAGFVFSAAHAGIHDGQMEPLHGHTFSAGARLFGTADPAGMVVDFHVVKAGMKAAIEPLRRRTLMPDKPVAGAVYTEDGQVIVECGNDWYSFPRRSVFLLPVPNTTTEAIAGYLLDRLVPHLKGATGLERVELTLAEAPDTRAVAAADRSEGLW
ncbi:6-carboxytetrahydropterin synthase [Planomonospora sp. ID82291]|uniref:6-pyruvoyl trahydropterin synthase family protein n=1 Tax=Planomonospora sp. ID82291 TaxID=2738136 RepID=UPI0018C3C93B|nr:6-carboxytetrahydropterin synthase [Planomonospora sp. ID82291]MBG0818462.1 6-carboxytetrahydropterin synthase [Planomonospora sp. ID82291]